MEIKIEGQDATQVTMNALVMYANWVMSLAKDIQKQGQEQLKPEDTEVSPPKE